VACWDVATLGGGPLGTVEGGHCEHSTKRTRQSVSSNATQPSRPIGFIRSIGSIRSTIQRSSRDGLEGSHGPGKPELQQHLTAILSVSASCRVGLAAFGLGPVHFSCGFLLISLPNFSTGRRSEHKRDKTSQAKAERGGVGAPVGRWLIRQEMSMPSCRAGRAVQSIGGRAPPRSPGPVQGSVQGQAHHTAGARRWECRTVLAVALGQCESARERHCIEAPASHKINTSYSITTRAAT
jgi:hypothetical protein